MDFTSENLSLSRFEVATPEQRKTMMMQVKMLRAQGEVLYRRLTDPVKRDQYAAVLSQLDEIIRIYGPEVR